MYYDFTQEKRKKHVFHYYLSHCKSSDMGNFMKLKFNPLPLGDGLNFFLLCVAFRRGTGGSAFLVVFFEDYGIIISKNNLIYQDDFSKYAEKIWRIMKHNVLFEDRF